MSWKPGALHFDKRQTRPPEAAALSALQSVHGHLQQCLFAADRRHAKPADVSSLETARPLTAAWAGNMLAGCFARDDKGIAEDVRVAIGDAFDATGMI